MGPVNVTLSLLLHDKLGLVALDIMLDACSNLLHFIAFNLALLSRETHLLIERSFHQSFVLLALNGLLLTSNLTLVNGLFRIITLEKLGLAVNLKIEFSLNMGRYLIVASSQLVRLMVFLIENLGQEIIGHGVFLGSWSSSLVFLELTVMLCKLLKLLTFLLCELAFFLLLLPDERINAVSLVDISNL